MREPFVIQNRSLGLLVADFSRFEIPFPLFFKSVA